MKVLPALLPLLVATTAYAQAPGDMEPIAPPAPAYAQPPVVANEWSVMSTRWSIGLSLGQSSVSPSATPDAKTDFSIGELAVRYRLRPEWEAELTLGGGNEKLADGTQGDRQLTAATLGLRYRFRPTEQLNWFLTGGIGASAIASQNATSDERDAATRTHVQIGGGVEYRFTHFALQAELRLTAMGAPKGSTNQPVIQSGGALADVAQTNTDTMTAGQMTIGASYYF